MEFRIQKIVNGWIVNASSPITYPSMGNDSEFFADLKEVDLQRIYDRTQAARDAGIKAMQEAKEQVGYGDSCTPNAGVIGRLVNC